MSAEAGLSWSEVLLVLLMALISALTVVGNLVVLLSFALDRQIRQPSNFFIFSLAVSDLVGMQLGEGERLRIIQFWAAQTWASSRAELWLQQLWTALPPPVHIKSIWSVPSHPNPRVDMLLQRKIKFDLGLRRMTTAGKRGDKQPASVAHPKRA